jgi:hypothetical protein
MRRQTLTAGVVSVFFNTNRFNQRDRQTADTARLLRPVLRLTRKL